MIKENSVKPRHARCAETGKSGAKEEKDGEFFAKEASAKKTYKQLTAAFKGKDNK